jgi:hypothetical protein
MTLRIEPVRGRIRISGDFRSEHLDQVKAEIERSESPVVLDLEELNLVDVECVVSLTNARRRAYHWSNARLSSEPGCLRSENGWGNARQGEASTQKSGRASLLSTDAMALGFGAPERRRQSL